MSVAIGADVSGVAVVIEPDAVVEVGDSSEDWYVDSPGGVGADGVSADDYAVVS